MSISQEQKRRHANNTDQWRCADCNSFVSVTFMNRKGRYVCSKCGHPGMVYR